VTRDVASLIINLGIGRRWVASCTHRPLYLLVKSSHYPLSSLVQPWIACFREDKMCLPCRQ